MNVTSDLAASIARRIDISRCGYKRLFVHSSRLDEELEFASKHGILGLSCHWGDLPSVARFHFESLSVETDAGADLRPLERMPWLTELAVGRFGQSSVDLRAFDHLRGLTVTWSRGIHLPPSMPRLEFLTLRKYTPTGSDLRAIHAPNVTDLEITEGSIRSLAGLELMPKLRKLALNYLPRLERVDQVGQLEALEVLHSQNCKLAAGWETLSNCHELTDLMLDGAGQMASLAFVGLLPKLKNLVIMGNTEIVDGDLSPAAGVERIVLTKKRHYSHTDSQLMAMSRKV